MNCEKCQELLSEFLDGTLGHREHAALSAHLAACPACALARQEFHAIISAARDSRDYLYSPPDERTLWLRVSSAVEREGRRADAGRASRRVVSDEFYPSAYLEPHEANLRYWQQRVEARKASWNPRMRASFDRSLSVLDQTVNDSLDDLRQNPHDEVAEEMLNSALRDKIELLKEFGEQ